MTNLPEDEELNRAIVGYRRYVQEAAGVYSFATEKKVSKKQLLAIIKSLIQEVDRKARETEAEYNTNHLNQQYEELLKLKMNTPTSRNYQFCHATEILLKAAQKRLAELQYPSKEES